MGLVGARLPKPSYGIQAPSQGDLAQKSRRCRQVRVRGQASSHLFGLASLNEVSLPHAPMHAILAQRGTLDLSDGLVRNTCVRYTAATMTCPRQQR